MEYLSVKDMSIRWDISERRVRAYLADNRIEGAKRVGKTWLIPSDSEKPSDKRETYQFDKVRKVEEKEDFSTYLKRYPNEKGYFGKYGGAFLPKELEKPFKEIYDAYLTICKSSDFIADLRKIRKHYQGRPTPIYYCRRLSESLGKVQIYLKREDLNYTGSHKPNHTMGEGLLAKYLGKKKLIAETGAGSHGTAVATAAAYYGLECDIYMGEVDMKKQAPNVSRMRILGARVIPVKEGAGTLKEAVDAAFEAYSKEYKTALYCIGSAVGPHPFPMMIRDFQSIIGIEAREQFLEMTGELPDVVCACVGGGSNSIGMFTPFLNDSVRIVGVEPLGKGKEAGQNAASMSFGKEGIMHGFNSIMLQDDKGNPGAVYSIASGLDYPAVGPEHALLHDLGRVEYDSVTDDEAVDAFFKLCKLEGIISALESAHAVAYAIKLAKKMHHGSILVNLSGRGDKDIDYIIEHCGEKYNIK